VTVPAPPALSTRRLVAAIVALATLGLVDAPTAGFALHARALVELVLSGGLGGLAYVAVTWALRLPELGLIMRLMSDTLSRLRTA